MFIDMLQKEQAMNEAKIIQINAGGVVHLKKWNIGNWIHPMLNSRLNDRRRQSEIGVVAYADAPSRLIHFEWKTDN